MGSILEKKVRMIELQKNLEVLGVHWNIETLKIELKSPQTLKG